MTIRRVTLLGFGEVGTILAEDLARAGDVQVTAYDSQFGDPDSGPARALRAFVSIRGAATAPTNCSRLRQH